MIQLRVRDDALQELGYERKAFTDAITSYATENMADIDYGLIVGLIPGKANADIAKTQCAHLVWYVYNQFGMEIDSDGGWLVTPCDIANSPIFEVVQVYGVNPDEIWS